MNPTQNKTSSALAKSSETDETLAINHSNGFKAPVDSLIW